MVRRMDDSSDSLSIAFGRRLASLRAAAGLTQSELARKSNMQRAYIWRVEDGRTLPSLRTAAKLAEALDISLSELLAEI